jgi:hypothetical protein
MPPMVQNGSYSSKYADIAAHIEFEPGVFKQGFDREPFAFAHNLHTIDVFGSESLGLLAKHYADYPQDYFVSAGAPSAATDFFSVPHGHCKPHEAMERLDSAAIRILLKRPEDHDPRFRKMLDLLFRKVIELRGGLGSEKLVRLESAIFITSASATTPFHFDPEIAFFSQVAGEKIYHVYSPSILGEPELEHFYLQGVVNIGQVPLHGRDPGREHVFALGPGKGLHQPQNSPHWVETCAQRSISYSFVFETDATRAAGRTRAFNHYLRKLGLEPRYPGTSPSLDAVKAGSMRVLLPVRRRASRLLHRLARLT